MSQEIVVNKRYGTVSAIETDPLTGIKVTRTKHAAGAQELIEELPSGLVKATTDGLFGKRFSVYRGSGERVAGPVQYSGYVDKGTPGFTSSFAVRQRATLSIVYYDMRGIFSSVSYFGNDIGMEEVEKRHGAEIGRTLPEKMRHLRHLFEHYGQELFVGGRNLNCTEEELYALSEDFYQTTKEDLEKHSVLAMGAVVETADELSELAMHQTWGLFEKSENAEFMHLLRDVLVGEIARDSFSGEVSFEDLKANISAEEYLNKITKQLLMDYYYSVESSARIETSIRFCDIGEGKRVDEIHLNVSPNDKRLSFEAAPVEGAQIASLGFSFPFRVNVIRIGELMTSSDSSSWPQVVDAFDVRWPNGERIS